VQGNKRLRGKVIVCFSLLKAEKSIGKESAVQGCKSAKMWGQKSETTKLNAYEREDNDIKIGLILILYNVGTRMIVLVFIIG